MTRSVVYGPSVTLDAGGNKWVNLADGVAASDAATVGQIAGGSVTYGTPAVVLGTAAAAGSIAESIRRDSTIVAFDATSPTTQAFGDSAATGSAAIAARRDHKHAMPAAPVTSLAKSGSTALTGAVTLTGGTNVTLTQSGQDISIASSGGGSSLLVKLYDYEVASVDKASIDTFVDGSTVTDFSGYNVLDIWMLLRSDDTGAVNNYQIVLNNDTTSIYDLELTYGNNATAGAASVLAAANWNISGLHGGGGSATYAAVTRMTIPFPNSTTFWKTMELGTGIIDATAGNNWDVDYKLGYRSTAAITRLAIAPATALKKFKVGSRLVVYGR